MNIKNVVYYLATVFLGVLFFSTVSYATTGYIDTSATNNAKVCKDSTCTSPTPGIINFELSAVSSIVVDSVTGISGYVWGNELGWILLNPTGQGVTFANSTTGLLTGKAWSQVSGWVNFAPTGQSVTINPTTGELSGWAWTGGPYGGWIKFDCGDASTCVKTTWRYSASSSGGGGGGGGGGALIDVCPNITGAQQTIPSGYTVDASGNCIVVLPDICPNLAGEQSSLPYGYTLSSIGSCEFLFIDFCENISGDQTTVPSGYTVNSAGMCVKIERLDVCPTVPGIQTSYNSCKEVVVPNDSCANIPGIQETIPSGYQNSAGACIPLTYDICPNLEGTQIVIPEKHTITANGDCVFLPSDLCSNLAGYQNEVPRGFKKEGEVCIFEIQKTVSPTTTNKDNIKTIALPFIPKSSHIPSDNVILKTIVKTFNSKNTAVPFRVDVVSAGLVGVTGIGIFLGLLLLIRFLRKPF